MIQSGLILRFVLLFHLYPRVYLKFIHSLSPVSTYFLFCRVSSRPKEFTLSEAEWKVCGDMKGRQLNPAHNIKDIHIYNNNQTNLKFVIFLQSYKYRYRQTSSQSSNKCQKNSSLVFQLFVVFWIVVRFVFNVTDRLYLYRNLTDFNCTRGKFI